MDKDVFQEFCRLVYDTCGIRLTESKEALVSSRIGKRMRAMGIEDYREYLDLVKSDKTAMEIVYMVDAISTNVTNFFREAEHFSFLTEVAEKWRDSGQNRFRFWCAASSTGEEPYTIAMTLNEAFAGPNIDWKILATDISVTVLEQCEHAVYDAKKVDHIPAALRHKYFTKIGTREKPDFEVKDTLKNHILFRRLNLATPPFPMKGPMDAIFIRNVMIYFDNLVRDRLIKEAVRLLRPGGYLLVGHAESLNGITNGLKTIRPSIYQKA